MEQPLLDTATGTVACDATLTRAAAMHAWVLSGHPGKAWELLEGATASGTALVTLEYNIALGAGARSGKLREATALLQWMRQPDARATPDVGSYDAVLQPLASAGRYETVLRLFDDMHSAGLSPIEFHYRLAISACASLGNGSRAASLLLRMQERGMLYTQAVADAMQACTRGGQPDVALDIFEAVRHDVHAPRRGVRPLTVRLQQCAPRAEAAAERRRGAGAAPADGGGAGARRPTPTPSRRCS